VNPHERLRHHVTGAIERGEAEPITEIRQGHAMNVANLKAAAEFAALVRQQGWDPSRWVTFLCDLITTTGQWPEVLEALKQELAAAKTKPSGLYACANCSFETENALDMAAIKDFDQRHEPGDIVADGQCPECGALCFKRN